MVLLLGRAVPQALSRLGGFRQPSPSLFSALAVKMQQSTLKALSFHHGHNRDDIISSTYATIYCHNSSTVVAEALWCSSLMSARAISEAGNVRNYEEILPSSLAARLLRVGATLTGLHVLWNATNQNAEASTKRAAGDTITMPVSCNTIGFTRGDLLTKQNGLPHDHPYSQHLSKIGIKVVDAITLLPAAVTKGISLTHLKDIEWEFVVIESSEIRACVYRGGRVEVTTGLMNLVTTSELAMVIGHECAHVIHRDFFYKFGQGWEREKAADIHGMKIAAQAGFNPEAAVTFMEKLQHDEREDQRKAEGQGQRLYSDFISTHPPALERKDLIILNLKDAQKIYNDANIQRRILVQRGRGVMPWVLKVIGYHGK